MCKDKVRKKICEYNKNNSYIVKFRILCGLKSNRKYSGSLRLYEKHGLKLVDGELFWNPITLKKISCRKTDYSSFKPKLLALRLVGLYLALGRFTILPFLWINSYQRKGRRWFKE